MHIKKNLLLILLCATTVQNIDAGWRDQWAWIKNFFGIKKFSVTNKQIIAIGAVGGLAIAGSAWWYYNWRQRKGPSSQNPAVPGVPAPQQNEEEELKKQRKFNIDLQEKQEGSGQNSRLAQLQQKIIRPKEQIDFQVGDVVKIVQGPSYRFQEAIDHLGIVTEVFDKERLLTVDIVPDGLNKRPTRLLSLSKQAQGFFEKVEIEKGQKEKISMYQEVVFDETINQEKIRCIGRVIEQNNDNDEIKVIGGLRSKAVGMRGITCKASDVYVEKTQESFE